MAPSHVVQMYMATESTKKHQNQTQSFTLISNISSHYAPRWNVVEVIQLPQRPVDPPAEKARLSALSLQKFRMHLSVLVPAERSYLKSPPSESSSADSHSGTVCAAEITHSDSIQL